MNQEAQNPSVPLARVLVVEDEDDLRLTLYDWLTMRGHLVTTARDGLEALEIAARQSFDIVLTDLKMPRCDGLQLLTSLKRTDPQVDVIFLTGQASIQDAVEALRGGRSFDFLQKPLHDLRRLDDVLRRAMAQRAERGPSREAPRGPTGWYRVPAEIAERLQDEPSLQLAFRYMEVHFRSAISLSEVAAATGYSPAYLTTRMRKVTGKTVQQWIIDYKMAEAQKLLVESDWSVQKIALSLGYQDPNSFHRQFRKLYESAPQTWRQQAQGK